LINESITFYQKSSLLKGILYYKVVIIWRSKGTMKVSIQTLWRGFYLTTSASVRASLYELLVLGVKKGILEI